MCERVIARACTRVCVCVHACARVYMNEGECTTTTQVRYHGNEGDGKFFLIMIP